MDQVGFTHLDAEGRARMVDVTVKEPTRRRAVARGRVLMAAEVAARVGRADLPKGDVLAVARVAAIQAAKRTSELIPLCHQLQLGSVTVDFVVGSDDVAVAVTVEAFDRTGVEMEALTGCAVACLTVYDMCKALDRTMVISEVALWEKTGGRRGEFRRDADSDGSH